MFRFTVLASWALLTAACSHPPPPHWAEGGAPLALGRAHWERADDEPVDIDEQGQVFENGELVFVLDRAGRISDDEREPLALLYPAGEIVGVGNQYLGRIGVTNAAPPDSNQAWVAVMPDGAVTHFHLDGERVGDGRWQGCSGPMQRTCTLVTHLMLVRYFRPASPQVSVGIGVMVPL